MGFLLENIRLRELVAIVNENREFYDDFVVFLIEEGYGGIHEWTADAKALSAVHEFLRFQIKDHKTGDPAEARPQG
jgi:hypothetical protein